MCWLSNGMANSQDPPQICICTPAQRRKEGGCHNETSLDGQTQAFPPFCPLTMAAEVVYHPGVPSDLCLKSSDGVLFKVHKQVLACACGTFEHALDAELSGDELPVAETARQLQVSTGRARWGAENVQLNDAKGIELRACSPRILPSRPAFPAGGPAGSHLPAQQWAAHHRVFSAPEPGVGTQVRLPSPAGKVPGLPLLMFI